MPLSLKDLYKHFDYVRFESALTTIQVKQQEEKIKESCSSFLNKDFCAIGKVTDVTSESISVSISINTCFTFSNYSEPELITTGAFNFNIRYDNSFKEQAIKLNKSNNIKFCGQITSLLVYRKNNSSYDLVSENALKLGFQFYPQYDLKIKANKIEVVDKFDYTYEEISKRDLTRKEQLALEKERVRLKQKEANNRIIYGVLGVISFFLANFILKGHVFWSILVFILSGLFSFIAISIDETDGSFFDHWFGPISVGATLGILFYWFGWL